MKLLFGSLLSVGIMFGVGIFGAHAAEIGSQEYLDEIINGIRSIENQSYAELCIGSLPTEDDPIRARIVDGAKDLQAGDTLTLTTTFDNMSVLTVIDVAVVTKIYRVEGDEEKREKVGDHLIDQFVSSTISSLNAGESQTAQIEWSLPINLSQGGYYAVVSLVGSNDINLVGLPTTDNPAFFGPLHFFTVESDVSEGVFFNKEQTLVNAQPYNPFAALPLVIPSANSGVVNAVLKNTMPSAQFIEVTWEVYPKDSVDPDSLIETFTENVVIEHNEETHIGYSISNAEHTAYTVIIRAKYNQGSTVLLSASFTHHEPAPLGLTFAALSDFPLKKGEVVELVACVHNPDLLYALENGSFEVEIVNSRSETVARGLIQKPQHQMFEPFIVSLTPERNSSNVEIRASVIQSTDVVIDEALLSYDCDILDTTTGCRQVARTNALILAGVFVVVAGIAGYVLIRMRKKKDPTKQTSRS